MRPLSCAMITATLGLLLAADQALAVRGVKSLDFSFAQTICDPDQAFPCDPAAGVGESNIVYVHQSETNGQWTFDRMEVPGLPDNTMWIATRYGAECKTGYRIEHAAISTGWAYGHGDGGDAQMVHPDWTGWEVEHSGQKKISSHVVDTQMPIDAALDGDLVLAFESVQDVFDYGESVIEQRMIEHGQTEEEARAGGFDVETSIEMHGRVLCKGIVFGREGWKTKPSLVPMTFVFVGLGGIAETTIPIDPQGASNELTAGTHVTQAFLFAAPDANDSCRLRLTGAFRTNGATDISYRIVNELGHASQMFSTTVDQSFVSMIDHYVELPEVEYDDGQTDQLVTEQAPGFGEELTSQPTDREQGFYQIQVLEPHGYWSNVADYNVEPCQRSWQIADGLLPQEFEIDEELFQKEWQIAEELLPQTWNIAKGALPQNGRGGVRKVVE